MRVFKPSAIDRVWRLQAVCICGAFLVLFALPAGGQNAGRSLEEVLRRTGKLVEVFWQQFGEVNCSEAVSQVRLDKKGKVIDRKESIFDYLVTLKVDGNDLLVEELRRAQFPARNSKNTPLLVTHGFSTLVLIFHPVYQGNFEYALLGEEVVEGRKLLRVRFRHVSGFRSPSVLQLRGRDYPLDLQGTAWIEPGTGAIARIEAGLTASMEDIGLRVFRSDVRYAPMSFKDAPQVYWLPVGAEMEAETPRQHWRHVHRFTNYKRFSATMRIEPIEK